MPFPHNVYKTQRIVPLRFKRAISGSPFLGFPDIDDRGWFRPDPAGNSAATNDHGFVVGVTEGKTAYVKVKREKLENSATLFVESSNTAVMTVIENGGTDQLTTVNEPLLKIDGVSGGAGATPKIARVQIHFGTKTGPIIGELSVWVYKKVNVNLVPHNVTIRSAAAAGVASAANIASVMDTVKAIWETAGVDITVAAVQNDNVTFAGVGVAQWQAEVNTLLNTNWVPSSINAYFVNQIAMAGVPGVLGVGISRPNSVAFATPNPGIILGDTNVSGSNRAGDTHWLANDIAHEMGHFFTLPHVDNIDNSAAHQGREDSWALRLLMHPTNTHFFADHRNDTGYGTAGDGTGYRGALISLKDLVDSGNAAHHSTDAEVKTARTSITSVAGPY